MKFQYVPFNGEGELEEISLEKQQFLAGRREAAENIPRGGAYWMEDIVESLSSVCNITSLKCFTSRGCELHDRISTPAPGLEI